LPSVSFPALKGEQADPIISNAARHAIDETARKKKKELRKRGHHE
jgi:hypothetical protein